MRGPAYPSLYSFAHEIVLLDATQPISDWVDQSGYTLKPQTQQYCIFATPEHRIMSLAADCITLQKGALFFYFYQSSCDSILFCLFHGTLNGPVAVLAPLVRTGLDHPLKLGMQHCVSLKRVPFFIVV